MRIGIDLLAVQSPGSRKRGVGRYGISLVRALLAHDPSIDCIFYTYEDFPADELQLSEKGQIRRLAIDPTRDEMTLHDAIDRLARENPDDLDLLLILNPFELCPGYDPPARPLNGLKLAAVIYDLIPAIFQEQYLDEAPNADWFYRRLRQLQNYDVLLTISEATRQDCLRIIGLPEDRVVTIGGASDRHFFVPDHGEVVSESSKAVLERLGIREPYIFHVGGMDDRKNIWGLLDAFARLPESIRSKYLIVVTCAMVEAYAERVRRHAELRRIADRFVLTGPVSDEELLILYQRCSTFVFPSFYEGLGLPILEAMHCGAAIVAGNNSSQVEVVGDAGLLVNAADPGDIARAIARCLTDEVLASSLGNRALNQALAFSWKGTAERTMEAIRKATRRHRTLGLRADLGHRLRPRLAMFSPWPPKGSGIADYSSRLLKYLKEHYAIDLYHDEDYVPELGLGPGDFSCHDHRLFQRRAALLNYAGIVYHMGNSWYHRSVYEALVEHPGIVVLHDYCLSGFQFWYASLASSPPDHFNAELDFDSPELAEEYRADPDAWHREVGGIQLATARRGISMNRRVFDRSLAIIVHSPWCREQVRQRMPEFLDKTVVVPLGAAPVPVRQSHQSALRTRFDLPEDALIFGCFGILSSGKMNVETLEAFAIIAGSVPRSILIFVGEDWEQGAAQICCRELGLEDRVRFLGRQSAEDFAALLTVTDVGISLRRPPTFGETSASLLDLLRSGIATIVNEVGTFSDYPDSVVRKVSLESEGVRGLALAMLDLATNPTRRAELGRLALRHVAREHDWRKVARRYAEVIERSRPDHPLLSGRNRHVTSTAER
ncbi:hypothetical protein BH23PLA1_BH23PLA1_11470 [soil metagenome]